MGNVLDLVLTRRALNITIPDARPPMLYVGTEGMLEKLRRWKLQIPLEILATTKWIPWQTHAVPV
jgi:hypothetical protein